MVVNCLITNKMHRSFGVSMETIGNVKYTTDDVMGKLTVRVIGAKDVELVED